MSSEVYALLGLGTHGSAPSRPRRPERAGSAPPQCASTILRLGNPWKNPVKRRSVIARAVSKVTSTKRGGLAERGRDVGLRVHEENRASPVQFGPYGGEALVAECDPVPLCSQQVAVRVGLGVAALNLCEARIRERSVWSPASRPNRPG